MRFLSTPSARRATGRPGCGHQIRRISIHALREEGDINIPAGSYAAGISIHALREEGDTAAITTADSSATFLSTPSARRATPQQPVNPYGGMDFYPRPPRGGRLHFLRRYRLWANFYPRPPRGGRRPQLFRRGPLAVFLSTPSARRATLRARLERQHLPISIHALREEGDLASSSSCTASSRFLSTPSARRATCGV